MKMKNIFPVSKIFTVRKNKNQIPCSPCPMATLLVFCIRWPHTLLWEEAVIYQFKDNKCTEMAWGNILKRNNEHKVWQTGEHT